MKTSSVIVALSIFGSICVPAQTAKPTQPPDTSVPVPTAQRVVNRGANHRLWQWETYEKTPGGNVAAHVHKYTELATGLHYKDSTGRWVETKEQIDILPDGTAAATQGQHRAYFPANINRGVIHLVTPDGLHLKSRPLGIGYDDGNQTLLLSQLKDSTGQVVNDNQVVYPDCFTGLKADLIYTYKKGGFEQDVILHEQPPDAASFGLNPATTKLQVLTEYFNPPEPRVKTHRVKNARSVSDTTLSFGQTVMGHGRAFLVGVGSSPAQSARNNYILVNKSWVNTQGRTFLIEEVPLSKVEQKMATLPATSGNFKSQSGSMLCKASKTRWLPSAQPIKAGGTGIQLAKTDTKPAPAFVLDYVELNTDTNDLVLKGDTTYYLSSSINVNGTLTIEGGTVVKYASSVCLQCYGGVACATAPYRPAVFTYSGDNTVGENLGFSGSPDYSYEALAIDDDATPLSNLRISYAWVGIHDHSLTLRDSQFNDCYWAIQDEWWGGGGYPCYMTNVLMNNVQVPFFGVDFLLYGCNLTVAGCQQLNENWGDGNNTATFVNCLLVGVTNYGSAMDITTNCTAWPADNSIFQTVGGGGYYLPANSPYHNAGTTNLDPTTLADLAAKTTYAPVIFTNADFYAPTNFSPQAQRDNFGNPDLGYHYDPLDYAFGGCSFYTNVTFTAGTAVGWFHTSSGWYLRTNRH